MSRHGPCPWNAGPLVEEIDMQTNIQASDKYYRSGLCHVLQERRGGFWWLDVWVKLKKGN